MPRQRIKREIHVRADRECSSFVSGLDEVAAEEWATPVIAGGPRQAFEMDLCQADLLCLHGFAPCLWRTGQFGEAERVFDRMLWLDPSDNQGARVLLDEVRSKTAWKDQCEGRDVTPWLRRRNN